MILDILLYICIFIDIICFIKLYKIIKNMYILKKNLIDNTCIIIYDKPNRNNIYKITSMIFEYICNNFIFDINDEKNIIKKLKDKKKYNIILNTSGGNIVSNDILINFIITSKIKLNIYINKKAQSAGTVFAFSATKLYIDKDAYLSPTDPQISFDDDTYSIRSFIELCENKNINNITDKYLLTYYENKKLYNENITLIKNLLKNKFRKNISKDKKQDFIFDITYGFKSHHTPYCGSYLNKILDINLNLPKNILEINDLFDDIYEYL